MMLCDYDSNIVLGEATLDRKPTSLQFFSSKVMQQNISERTQKSTVRLDKEK